MRCGQHRAPRTRKAPLGTFVCTVTDNWDTDNWDIDNEDTDNWDADNEDADNWDAWKILDPGPT